MSILSKIRRRISYYILVLKDYIRFKKESGYIGSNCYVLISHDANGAGGAPVVLFELAKLLRNSGSDVVFLSYKSGSLMKTCNEAGIHGYVTGRLNRRYLRAFALRSPACFIANTMICHGSVRFLLENYKDERVIWWVHEENRIIREYAKYINFVPHDKFKLLCVSERVKAAIEKCVPSLIAYTTVMYYGCCDLLVCTQNDDCPKDNGNKYSICSIGYVSERKNQLQLVDAVERLPKEIRDNIEVQFVYGGADESYLQKVNNAIKGKPYYKLVGSMPRSQIAKLYANMDLLVCSSIDDPLPVVVTEAMMMYTPFITSSETGQYALVENGVNGYTYSVSNTDELTQKIILAYSNRNDVKVVQNARALFESTFSLEILRKNFTELMI